MSNKATCPECGLHSSTLYYTGACPNRCGEQPSGFERMTPDDILSRLSAGLDRDEQLARAAAEVDGEGTSWRVRKVRDNGMYVFGDYAAIPPNGKGERLGLVDDAQTHHIEAHDPARVLERYVPAIRKVLRQHSEAERDSVLSDRDAGFEAGLYAALESLASIYADPTEAGGEP